ncbi:hypothetical protein [Corynebacterium sp.]|uniref:hypothetical protein n=1 Tax=Corynebacterium sp. TaxID=1720 RepID=UPI0026DAB6EE|nr:hypothetical protein [Corynebacterium sp.]MDO4611057.1 hypothetical protein [Corynebacterium sp.]
MDSWVIATMACVGVGFLLFGGAFAGFMYGMRRSLVLALCLGAALLVTVIPVIIALSVAI